MKHEPFEPWENQLIVAKHSSLAKNGWHGVVKQSPVSSDV
jgi:hypothetical protein